MSVDIIMATELSESFYITLIATASALLGLCVRYALRSKCDRVECCCIKIHRAVDLEAGTAETEGSPTRGNIYRQETEENIRL
jgi:hypothetical protein